MSKIKVGVLGVTGAVGQRIAQLLANHPYFDLTVLDSGAVLHRRGQVGKTQPWFS